MSQGRTKRADGRYIVNVTVDEPDGTKRRVYFYGRTQSEAKGKADAARERVALGAPVRDATRSVSDWLAEWRETFLEASDRATSTKSLYAGLTLRHVEPVIGRTPLGQARPSDITRVLLTVERSESAASTRRNAYAALRSAFDDAVADGLLALNPVLRVRRPKASSAEALVQPRTRIHRSSRSVREGQRLSQQLICAGARSTIPSRPRRDAQAAESSEPPTAPQLRSSTSRPY